MNIADSIQEYLITSRLRESSDTARKFYISDMGKCMRMRFLKRKGILTQFDSYVEWLFQMGDLLHDYGYKALEAQGILLGAEDSIETEHFKGRRDGVVQNGNEKSIFDFKSVGSYKLQKLMKGDDDEENIAQLLSYVMLAQEAKQDIGDTAYNVYINKEPSDKLPIAFFQKEYHLTTWRRKQLKEEMDKLVGFWNKGEIPPCSCPGWMKDYNSFQPLCGATNSEIEKYLKMASGNKKLLTTKRTLYLVDGENKKELKQI